MADTEADSINTKRRRLSPDTLHISILPDNIMADVASYLSKPSQALFAVAMTASPLSWRKLGWKGQPSATSKVIVSPSQWNILDFADIEENLASKLTDSDVGAVLVCIDAVRKLEKLKLTGCVRINGNGLDPLRRSIVIKQIDLSLAKEHQSPDIEPEPLITEQDVLPILDSIIDTNHNSLRHLHLPRKWRENKNPALSQFLDRYNRHLQSRGFYCSKCERRIENNSPFGWINHGSDVTRECDYGLHYHTCYNCMKLFCHDCRNGDDDPIPLKFCNKCERDYCLDCCQTFQCDKCGEECCTGCSSSKECQDCELKFCQDCGPVNICACWGWVSCGDCAPCYKQCENEGCNIAHCGECSRSEDPTIDYCRDCGKSFCPDCRFLECSKDEWSASCPGCLKLIAKVIPKLAKEIEKLRRENEDLSDKLREKGEH